jgi:hypothetical protein
MRSQNTPVVAVLATAAVVLLVMAGTYKTHLNEQRDSQFRERDAQIKAARALGEEVNDRVSFALHQRVSLDEFREEFGNLSEDDGDPDAGSSTETYRYVHPASRRAFVLEFRDGVFSGFRSSRGRDDVGTSVELESRGFVVSESIRAGVLQVCMVLWIAVLIGVLARPHWRRGGYVLLTVLSALCYLAWFLAPNYGPTWHSMLSNDALALGLLMFGVSLAYALSAKRSSRVEAQTSDA